jgi:hypothetical protein
MPNRRYSKAIRNRAANDSVAQRLSSKSDSPSQNEVVRRGMAFVFAVGLHGNSLAALRSVRRTIFCRLFFTARHCRASGSRYARRVQRHVLVLSLSGATTGNPCSGFGAYGNHRNLDCTLFTRSGAAPVNISPPAHSDLLLVFIGPALLQRGSYKISWRYLYASTRAQACRS